MIISIGPYMSVYLWRASVDEPDLAIFDLPLFFALVIGYLLCVQVVKLGAFLSNLWSRHLPECILLRRLGQAHLLLNLIYRTSHWVFIPQLLFFIFCHFCFFWVKYGLPPGIMFF